MKNVKTYDLVVIGGGINGAGIAADAAGRGLTVLLCEKNDLASATSSQSSKLIHGGLRYLEHGEFRLVKEALAEREILLTVAPHIVRPLRFRLPHRPHLRPIWMIKFGLFIYDHLAKRVKLPDSSSFKFDYTSPLLPTITHGFEYSDAQVDDARLVILNAMSAAEQGATILTHTKCTSAKRSGKHWRVTLQDQSTNNHTEIDAKAIVNATGPWVNDLFEQALEMPSPQDVRLVKGSHIIVPRLHDQHHAYLLQTEDQRVVFVIPYLEKFSLIGTTDVEYSGSPSDAAISSDEIDYLISITNDHFIQQICASDIISTYSGVRPLLAQQSSSAQDNSRDYCLEVSNVHGQAPLLSVFGGKITTYRKLSQLAVDQLCLILAKDNVCASASWTAHRRLPGGDFADLGSLTRQLALKYPWLDQQILTRYINTYGSYTSRLLYNINSEQQMGQHFGAGLYQCEVNYLQDYEWAMSSDDILWRRTKLGLQLSDEQVKALSYSLNHNVSRSEEQNLVGYHVTPH